MATALYRLTSKEVIKVSLQDQQFVDRDTTYWGVLTDPLRPDGDLVTDPDGNFRVLGYAKILETPNTVRNATQPEIDTFVPAEAEDENIQDAAQMTNFIDSHPRWRKIFKAFLKELVDELFNETNLKINENIDQWNQFKADVAAAANLGQLKASVAALPIIESNLKDSVTLQQAITKLKNQISKDD